MSKAIEYARLAGARALAGQAPDEAIRWYAKRSSTWIGRSMTTHRSGRSCSSVSVRPSVRGVPEHRETLIVAADLADEIGEVGLLVRAAIANNRGWSSTTGVVDEERVRVLRLALDRLGEVDTPERARLLGTLCAELLFGASFLERSESADSAVAVARRAGDERTLLDSYLDPGVDRRPGDVAATACVDERGVRDRRPGGRSGDARLGVRLLTFGRG